MAIKKNVCSPSALTHSLAIAACLLIAPGCNTRKPTPTVVDTPHSDGEPAHPGPTLSAENLPRAKPTSPDDAAAERAVTVIEPTTTEATQPASAEPATAEPLPTWSTQRIVALGATGPIVIDLSVNIGGMALEEAAATATSRAVARIASDLEKPWSWADLLSHPLVRSGWLGNLVSEDEQRDQLISMYDSNDDQQVDDDELPGFLTRGLARGKPLRFTDIGNAPTATGRRPWEHLDSNRDGSLDSSELAEIPAAVTRLDLNSDRVVTRQELQANADGNAAMPGMGSSMIVTKSAFALGAEEKPRDFARKISEHYTSFGYLPRALWPDWNDSQWADFDANGDNQLSTSELERITSVQANLDMKIQFDSVSPSISGLSAQAPPRASGGEFTWASRLATAGQASGKACALTVTLRDTYAAATRTNLRGQLAAALVNPQVAAAIRNQFQLSPDAFDVLDADQNDQLSDAEFEQAWEWLTAIRGTRILARWMISESAWYQLADRDADERLTEVELRDFPNHLLALDRDQDGTLARNELPLVVRLEAQRDDDRFTSGTPVGVDSEVAETGWFAASDSNSDGFLNNLEFVGSNEDFVGYDADKDGFISRLEAYQNADLKIQ